MNRKKEDMAVKGDNVLSDSDNEFDKRRQNSFKNYAEASGVDLTHVEVDVGIFESYTLLLSALGTLEFGFTYTTIFCQIICTVGFAELVKLQRQKDKETKIVIKSKILEWYLFFCFQFMLVPKYWLTMPLLKKSDMAPEVGSIISLLCYQYHNLAVFSFFMLGMIMFVISL